MKKKRQISLKAIQAALKSPKTPERLRAGLLKKYGKQLTNMSFGNAPKMKKHELIIHSLHDAQAECPCGWSFVGTGQKTKEEIKEEWKRHLKKRNAPKEFHRQEANDSYKKFIKNRDPYDKGVADAHYASVFKRNPKKRKLGKNPIGKSKLIYDKILSISAQKGKKSHWPSENFEHDFSGYSNAKIYGNPDGSLLIKGKKPLWKRKKYSNKEIKDLGGKL